MMFIGLILFGTFLIYIVFVAGASRNNHQDWSGQEIRERLPGPPESGTKTFKTPSAYPPKIHFATIFAGHFESNCSILV